MSIGLADTGQTVAMDDRTLRKVARAGGVSVHEVREHIKAILDAGWLEVVGQDERGATVYALTIPEGER